MLPAETLAAARTILGPSRAESSTSAGREVPIQMGPRGGCCVSEVELRFSWPRASVPRKHPRRAPCHRQPEAFLRCIAGLGRQRLTAAAYGSGRERRRHRAAAMPRKPFPTQARVLLDSSPATLQQLVCPTSDRVPLSRSRSLPSSRRATGYGRLSANQRKPFPEAFPPLSPCSRCQFLFFAAGTRAYLGPREITPHRCSLLSSHLNPPRPWPADPPL
ncbi:hypothetical protein BDV96DRAFT_163814 [Lophiotrema nucula]|uniref:Uncharacterized protein n=1 Tax=Lophiotrema nucula TaxID=690887 RepID=A0A6A5YZ82_9PLEO|nr:hypothetical protein BDV96DRAFT_163814 [Lophiotrema nucula]